MVLRLVPLGTKFPHVARAIDVGGAKLHDLAGPGASQALQSNHVGDHSRQVWQRGVHHVISDRTHPWTFPGAGLAAPQALDTGEPVIGLSWDQFLTNGPLEHEFDAGDLPVDCSAGQAVPKHLFNFLHVAIRVFHFRLTGDLVRDHRIADSAQTERTETAGDAVPVGFQEAKRMANGFLFARRLPGLDVILFRVTHKIQHQFVYGQIGGYSITRLSRQATFT